MGSVTSTSSRVVLKAASSVTQTSIAKCTIECDQVLSNNTVIIAPGATVGNITFENLCVIKDASCMINQNIDTSIVNILNSTVDQAVLSTQPLFSLTFNATKSASSLEEVISNQIQQLINSNCTIATNQEMNNNYIYVGANATAGDISFVQHSNLSNVECVMDITAKATAQNEETGNVKQRATTIDGTTIIIIAIVLILIIVGVFVFIFLFRRVSSSIPKAKPATTASKPATAIPVGKPIARAVPVKR
jgi:hypothetical protein